MALFAFKHWEVKHGRVFAYELRERADGHTMRLKQSLNQYISVVTARMWPLAVLVVRYFIHRAALGAADLSHKANMQAHRVADMVSHKQRLANGLMVHSSGSEFLQKVSSFKHGATRPIDIQ